MSEVAVYTMLAAGIASGVFIIGGRPYWHAGLAVATALVIIVILAIISRRTGRPAQSARSKHIAHRSQDVSDWPLPLATSRRGRRRRK